MKKYAKIKRKIGDFETNKGWCCIMAVRFHLDGSKQLFSPSTIGISWKQPIVYRANGHHYYHWLQTESGCGNIKIENKEYSLPSGSGILIAPFTPHGYFRTSKEVWYTNFITIQGTFCQHIPEIIGNTSYYIAHDSDAFSYSEWLKGIMREMEHESVMGKGDFTEEIFRFFMQIRKGQGDGVRIFENDVTYQSYVLPALQYIEKHYMNNITAKHIADAVYITPQYLTTLFKRYLERSPYQFLTSYRMKKAKELLITSPELKISEISLQIGMQDTSNFITQFKINTGTTPKQFKRMY